jgi:hypothetical protein
MESEEQSMFRRLAVLANGATLMAAEQVCLAAGTIDGNVLEVLEELVDKSMLQRQERKTVRCASGCCRRYASLE